MEKECVSWTQCQRRSAQYVHFGTW